MMPDPEFSQQSNPSLADQPFGLSDRTLAEIQGCLARFPQIHWVKVYGSRANGTYRPGSDVDLAVSCPLDCTAALAGALEELPTPYRFDVTHWESLQHQGLRSHIERMGIVMALSTPA